MTSKEIIKSIKDNWRLDARQEANEKYFFSYDEVQAILNSDKCYVIGRKGTGKTAICQHIIRMTQQNCFSERLGFKNYPFNELYALQDEKYSSKSQYITLWKYLIYSTICRMMSKNNNVNKEIKELLLKLYPQNDTTQLARKVNEWTDIEFGVNVLGNGASLKVGRNVVDAQKKYSWIEKVSILEDIIKEYAGDSKYYIVFDELDEDYRDVYNQNSVTKYEDLLTSLFKAVQDVKDTFNGCDVNVMPIVFLRDDIYSRLKDPDKNKWSDFKIELEWSSEKIKRLIAYRISKDADKPELAHNFGKAWNSIFHFGNITYGDRQGKETTQYEFIQNSTQLRPRDFIKYIQACCATAYDKGEWYISNETIKAVDREFSNYLIAEIKDEIYPLLPEIDIIFQILSHMRKQIFQPSEFIQQYNNYLENKTVQEANVSYVLDVLFNFSIIGNQHRSQADRKFFKYLHTNMTYNAEEAIVLHRGLLKALQIF